MKNVFLILAFLFISGCFATTQVLTPQQILEAQEREEKIINDHLTRKLDPIEGIWEAKYGVFKRNEAIYKRGEAYLRVPLSKVQDTGKIFKKGENVYTGTCGMKDLFEIIKGDLEVTSIDDDTLSLVCTRDNYISTSEKVSTNIGNASRCLFCRAKKPTAKNFNQKAVFKRLWPENLKEYNSKF